MRRRVRRSLRRPVGENIINEEDMINQLPDSLLCEILFNLPTKDVVKTSLLCKRWRNLWQSVLGLDLVNINGFEDSHKLDFLNRFIELNRDFCLKRVKLRYVGYRQYDYLNTPSINIVIKGKIQHLDVESTTRLDRVSIPPTIYTSCKRLVSLKLYRARLPKSPKSVSLPCLKIMDLQQIKFVDRLGMEKLISACPTLETLTIDRMYGDKVSSQSLLSFCLTKCEYGYQTTLVMQTPKLKCLKLNSHFIERFIINDLSSIVKLNLDDLIYFGVSFPSFLIVISSVRDLTISFDILEVINDASKSKSLPTFHNLSSLSVKGMIFGSWEKLLIFFESCPNLKSLAMEFQDYNWGINFSDVPHCVLSSLEFVEVKARDAADMEKLGSYFMENSLVLKKFTLCFDHSKEGDHVIFKKPFTLPRRSNTCEVVVCSRTFGKLAKTWNYAALDRFSQETTWKSTDPRGGAEHIWFRGANFRHAFIMWLTHLDRLPTRARLANWGLQNQTSCCLCGMFEEIRDHLFLKCKVSEILWVEATRRLGYQPFSFHTWVEFSLWLDIEDNISPLNLRRMVAQAIIYNIWMERNNRHHNNIFTDPHVLFKEIDRQIRDAFLAEKKPKFKLMKVWLKYDQIISLLE